MQDVFQFNKEVARIGTSKEKEDDMHPDRIQFHGGKTLPLILGLAAFALAAMTVTAPAQQSTTTVTRGPEKVTITANAVTPPKIKRVHVTYVPPNDGAKMYATYCGPCHGTQARGDGPAAPAFVPKPTDLTTLTAFNKGQFPKERIHQMLTEVSDRASQNSVEMPNWCPALGSFDRDNPSMVNLRVHNLISYLERVQVPNPNAVPATVLGGTNR